MSGSVWEASGRRASGEPDDSKRIADAELVSFAAAHTRVSTDTRGRFFSSGIRSTDRRTELRPTGTGGAVSAEYLLPLTERT